MAAEPSSSRRACHSASGRASSSAKVVLNASGESLRKRKRTARTRSQPSGVIGSIGTEQKESTETRCGNLLCRHVHLTPRRTLDIRTSSILARVELR